MNYRAVIVSASALPLVAALWLLLPTETAPETPVVEARGDVVDTKRTTASRNAPRAEVVRQIYALAPGDELHLRSSIATRIATRHAEQPMETLTVRVRGEWRVRCVAARGDDLALAFIMPDAACEQALDTRALDGTTLHNDLARGCVVHLDRRGRVLGYRFPDGVDARHRDVLRTFVSSTRAPLAPSDVAEWTHEERVPAGMLHLRLRREGESVVCERGAAAPPPGVDTTGHARARFLPDGAAPWWATVAVAEESTLAVRAAGLRVAASFTAAHELQGMTTGAADDTFAWDAPWASVDGHDEVAARNVGAEREHWLAALRGTTLAIELDRLAAALQSAAASDVRAAAERLMWLLRLDPQLVPAVAVAFRCPTSAEPFAAHLAAALAAAGHAAAQDTLAALTQDGDLSERRRLHALRAGFHLERPNAAMVAAAAQLSAGAYARALADTALLLCGAFAADDTAVPANATASSADALARLLQRESSLVADGRVDVWLHALGNTGRPAVAPIALPYLAHDDPRLRCAALSALRRLDTPEVAARLVACAQHDRDPLVRQSAVTTLVDQRSPDVRAALVRALDDPDEDVRLAAIQAIAAREDVAACRSALERASAADPSERVRRQATATLGTGRA